MIVVDVAPLGVTQGGKNSHLTGRNPEQNQAWMEKGWEKESERHLHHTCSKKKTNIHSNALNTETGGSNNRPELVIFLLLMLTAEREIEFASAR